MTEWAKNLNGTTGWKAPLGYRSGIDYVLAHVETASGRCAISGCYQPWEVAAHVKFEGDGRHFLILTCKGCNNQRGQWVEIRENAPRVLANARELVREVEEDLASAARSGMSTGQKVALGACIAVVVTGLGALAWDAWRPKPLPPSPPPAP